MEFPSENGKNQTNLGNSNLLAKEYVPLAWGGADGVAMKLEEGKQGFKIIGISKVKNFSIFILALFASCLKVAG